MFSFQTELSLCDDSSLYWWVDLSGILVDCTYVMIAQLSRQLSFMQIYWLLFLANNQILRIH